MIDTLYFQNNAVKYRYELERLFRSFFLPSKLAMYDDTEPVGNDYAEFSSNGESLSVTVCGDEPITEAAYLSDLSEEENTLCALLLECMRKYSGKVLPWGILTGVRPVKYIRSIYEKMGGRAEAYILNSLMVTEEKLKTAKQIIAVQEPVLNGLNSRKISLYISIPFCPSRCSYCSFVSSAGDSALKLCGSYTGLLIKELEYYRELVNRFSLVIDTVYIGGGTPTVLGADKLALLLEELNKFDLSGVREFTAEAGRPDTITEEKLAVLKNGGVQRISINPQSMNDSVLRAVGRLHTEAEVIKAFEAARKVGFDCINSDLIAGLPTETPDSFEKSLRRLSVLEPENITVHTLSLKRSSALFRTFGEDVGRGAAQMTATASEILEENGYIPYYMYRQKNIADNLENTGYCKPGKESLYNIYITEEVQTILAAGCAASTKLYDGENVSRVINYKYPFEYIDRFELMQERKSKISEFFRLHNSSKCDTI